jgi:GNAT superfamily N-acetyltransferase
MSSRDTKQFGNTVLAKSKRRTHNNQTNNNETTSQEEKRLDNDMLNIRNIDKETTWALRQKVLWPGKALEYVKLEDDDYGMHYGLFVENRLVSVISLFTGPDGAQFRKFATLEEEQGKGYGSELLRYLINEARQRGVVRIWCNARKSKSGYYRKFGLEETDRLFIKGGIEYVVMERHLNSLQETVSKS